MDNKYIVVKESEINSKGVFANKDISKGKIIGEFNGKICSLKEAEEKKFDMNYLLQLDWDKWMLVESKEKYLNHSCGPNIGIKNNKLITLKDIRKNEELTIDYDLLEWDHLGDFMKCGCKSKNCRKLIRGYKYLDEETKIKYKGFIPGFLSENINQN